MIDGKIVVHFRAPAMTFSGYGAHSREVLDYLLSHPERFIVAFESINWGNCSFLQKDDFKDLETFHKYVQCMSIYDQLKDKKAFDMTIHVSVPNEFSRTSNICIGITAGIEVDRATREWVNKCNEMDLLVVPSKHAADVLAGTVYTVKTDKGETHERVTTPIEVIPEYFQKPEEIKPLDIEFSTRSNLLFVGQWGNKGGFGEDRKNLANLVKYFLGKFADEKDYGLILKTQTVNGSTMDRDLTLKKLQEIKQNFKNVKCKIHLLHEDFTDEEMWSLYHHPQVDGFVSLTHGEGFGRPLLEAAAAGLPVLAVNWSGHKDFLRKGKGFIPISHEMTEIPDCQIWPGVIDKGSKWASASEESAVKNMRKFLSGPSKIKREAQKNVEWIEENFSRKAVEAKWEEFFGRFVKSSEEEGFPKDVNPEFHKYVSEKEKALKKLNKFIDKDSTKKKVLYVIPQSAGDCLISTSIINSLIQMRHPVEDCDFYVATTEPFLPLFEGLVEEHGVKVIPYDHQLMFQSELTREVWDVVYAPGVNIQFTFSNWLLGNGEYSLKLLEEFAKSCNLAPQDIRDYKIKMSDCETPERPYVVVAPGGQKSSKVYNYWPDIITNLKGMISSDFDIVQVGSSNEPLLDGVLDYRGRQFSESFFVIDKATALIGVDSFPAHAAGALGTPHLVMYASTHARTCAPVMISKKVPQVLVEEFVECQPKCYKDKCMKSGKNCLSHIEPEKVCESLYILLEEIEKSSPNEDV